MSEKKEETEDKPKAVIEMEENSDKGKAKKRIKEKKELSAKEANKRFLIKFLVYVLILVIITGVAIYFSIKFLNKKEITDDITETKVTKYAAEDSKYGIQSYDETYDENSITFKYYDSKDNLKEDRNWDAEYIQINGLLDKSIENSINDRLKSTAKNMKDGSKKIYSGVTANFGNIISVCITNYEGKKERLNIDLTTGKDISIDDVFVSSAPINTMIMEGVYKTLAWTELYSRKEEDWFDSVDMDKINTSEYEDIALKVVNNFKKQKENLQFNISCSGITIDGITDPKIFKKYDNDETSITINFINYKEEIAIFKRFLTDKSIYENDSIGRKNVIVFTEAKNIDYFDTLKYGKIQDNIFMDEELLSYYDKEKVNEKAIKSIKEYMVNIEKEDEKLLVSQTNNNEGVFYIKEIILYYYDNLFHVDIRYSKATCDISYIKEFGFRDYIEMTNGERADVGLNMFYKGEGEDNKNTNLKIENPEMSQLYFDIYGNFIGNTKEEAEEKLKAETNTDQDKKIEETKKVEETNTEKSKEDNNSNTNNEINDKETNTNTNTNNTTE